MDLNITNTPTTAPTLPPTPQYEEEGDLYNTIAFFFLIFVMLLYVCFRPRTRNYVQRRYRIRSMEAIGAPYDEEIAAFDFSNFITIIEYPVNQTNCVICIEDFEEYPTICLLPKCQHIYHKHCINTWLNENPICPICRTSIF